MKTKKLLATGAEASIYLVEPRDAEKQIHKSRIPKTYRHPKLDEQLRRRRTKREAKILMKALSLKVNVPKVLKVDKYDLQIEFIPGDRLSETLNSYPEEKQFSVMKALGEQTALLHKHHIIHGDLTTSNVILNEGGVFIIDFGLGFVSRKIEDKAVDLHLIKQALEAKHWQHHEKLFEAFLKGYILEDKKAILERLRAVERRGRYRH